MGDGFDPKGGTSYQRVPKGKKAKGRDGFLNEHTREVMARRFCVEALSNEEGAITPPPPGDKLYPAYQYAVTKKWVSAKDNRVLTPGWDAAAAFLRR